MKRRVLSLEFNVIRDWELWGFAFAVLIKGVEIVIPGLHFKVTWL